MAVTHHTLSVAVCTSKHTISKWGRTEKHIAFILCPYTIELHKTLQQPAKGSPTFILRQEKNQPHYMQLETKTQRHQQLENSTKKVGLNSSLYQRWLQKSITVITKQIFCQFWPNQDKHNRNECNHILVNVIHKVSDRHLHWQMAELPLLPTNFMTPSNERR